LQDKLVATGEAKTVADAGVLDDHLAATAEQVAGIDNERDGRLWGGGLIGRFGGLAHTVTSGVVTGARLLR
jgi:hypothetical protein